MPLHRVRSRHSILFERLVPNGGIHVHFNGRHRAALPNQCRLVIELAVGTQRGQLSAQRRVVRQREAREAIGYHDAPTQPWCSSRPAWLPLNHLRPEAMVTHVFISYSHRDEPLCAGFLSCSTEPRSSGRQRKVRRSTCGRCSCRHCNRTTMCRTQAVPHDGSPATGT